MDPDRAKSLVMPRAKKSLVTDGAGDDPVNAKQKAIYGRCVMRGLYMALVGGMTCVLR